MNTRFLVTDTHPLVWYLSDEHKKLPKRVLSVYESAQEGGNWHIWVPAVVAWELSLLLRKTQRINLSGNFEELISDNFHFANLSITEVQSIDVVSAHYFQFNKDPFDSLIVAAAKRLNLPLITADEAITSSNLCSIFWR